MQHSYTQNWFKETREDAWNNYQSFKNLGALKSGKHLKCIEMGCLEGQSSVWILENLVCEHGHLYAIDMFNREEYFDHNIRVDGFEHCVTKMKGDGVVQMSSLLKEHEETFDFIYIDASKLACENSFSLFIAERLLSPGGLVIVDDYHWGKHFNPIMRPYTGVESFKKLSHLCSEIEAPCSAQAAFQKNIPNHQLIEIEKTTWQ